MIVVYFFRIIYPCLSDNQFDSTIQLFSDIWKGGFKCIGAYFAF